MSAFEKVIEAFQNQGLAVVYRSADQVDAQAPGHSPNDRSVSIRSLPGYTLLHSFTESQETVLEAVGLTQKDLYDNPTKGVDYKYSDGRIVTRKPGKEFHQTGNVKGTALYNVEAIKPETVYVYVPEGEQDVETLKSLDAVAVCGAMGAGKAGKFDWAPLKGKHVIVVADNDEPGLTHAAGVARECRLAGAASVKVVIAKEGKDATDHVMKGHGLDDFQPVKLPLSLKGNYADMGTVLTGGFVSPKPSILSRSDGAQLFYRGAVNVLFGKPESGKTWVALAAMAEELKRPGSRVVYCDLDHNGAGALANRLSQFGVPKSVLSDKDRFLLIDPIDSQDMLEVVSDMRDYQPDIITIDSTGELMPLMGAATNDSDMYTDVNRKIMKPLARNGACVLVIDHVAKNAEPGKGPVGAGAKSRAADGLMMQVEIRRAFTKARGGSAALTIAKDRHDGVRSKCQSAYIGDFSMNMDDGKLKWNISSPMGWSDV